MSGFGSRLFSPLALRGRVTRNRVVVSPMCVYAARDGMANEWHLVHYGKFAVGGAGIVMTEATAVEQDGRITYGCMGLWSDAHIEPLRRIAEFVRSQGALPGIQLAHAGRKGSCQIPWDGAGPLNEADAMRGEKPWPLVGPSALPANAARPIPEELTLDRMREIRRSWGAAARRAGQAGFDVVEIHGAHGYLLHTFLSPISNHRTDRYGGNLENRMRYPLEVAKEVRDNWPDDRPMFFRLSAIDDIRGGWTLDDSVVFARRLGAVGIDVIDCSGGGIDAGKSRTVATELSQAPGFQVPFAETIRKEADIRSLAVGLIVNARHAESILQDDQADLISMGRELLYNPNWPLHAIVQLEGEAGYEAWPLPFRRSMTKRSAWIAVHREPEAPAHPAACSRPE